MSRTVPFPTTRYQGSKQRLIPFLDGVISRLSFRSAVDVFGGTGVVSHYLKRLGKQVHFNDALRSSHATGVALIENDAATLDLERARELTRAAPGRAYDDVIARTYRDVYFLPEEDRWLDVTIQNVQSMDNRFERALALHALFQACLMKRPFNLFHRKNLSVRLADVQRSFGNKTTWERPFEALFAKAIESANRAVFDNGLRHTATCLDALACPLDAELVYLDPPYVRADGATFSYADGYHFLEGLTRYEEWPDRVDARRKHRPFKVDGSPFERASSHGEALFALLERARACPLVVLSYRTDGAPSIAALEAALEAQGRDVAVHVKRSSYALSTRASGEVLVVGARTRG
jgi:adenine-specific DNA-methyltransferase